MVGWVGIVGRWGWLFGRWGLGCWSVGSEISLGGVGMVGRVVFFGRRALICGRWEVWFFAGRFGCFAGWVVVLFWWGWDLWPAGWGL